MGTRREMQERVLKAYEKAIEDDTQLVKEEVEEVELEVDYEEE